MGYMANSSLCVISTELYGVLKNAPINVALVTENLFTALLKRDTKLTKIYLNIIKFNAKSFSMRFRCI